MDKATAACRLMVEALANYGPAIDDEKFIAAHEAVKQVVLESSVPEPRFRLGQLLRGGHPNEAVISETQCYRNRRSPLDEASLMLPEEEYRAYQLTYGSGKKRCFTEAELIKYLEEDPI